MPLSNAEKKRRQKNREVAQAWWPDGEEHTVWVVPDQVIYDLDRAIDLRDASNDDPIEAPYIATQAERDGTYEPPLAFMEPPVTVDDLNGIRDDISQMVADSMKDMLNRIEKMLAPVEPHLLSDAELAPGILPVNLDLLRRAEQQKPVDTDDQ